MWRRLPLANGYGGSLEEIGPYGIRVMQALLDRLVPLLLQQLIRDYDNWVQQKCEFSS
ncbi:hypothetical protein CK203_003800 [Vitis vinifera]|uniref:Uncharacterized protein n=1 Tax=Vitis vinifera TaxID=29760 RepID=A0A438K807_VITVI|nr:hypothetical protein CK203_069181 [Vitis vinifera]RVX17334.1 hypothetical protein CK203_003800 [Vitis vinifera]